MRVLVVDDEAAIRQVLTDILADEGHQVVAASNGREAIEVLGTVVPDVILLDMNMPVMDGRTFYRELRPQGWEIPVVVLSAVGARRVASDLGADAAIDKPFDLDEVLAVVETVGQLR